MHQATTGERNPWSGLNDRGQTSRTTDGPQHIPEYFRSPVLHGSTPFPFHGSTHSSLPPSKEAADGGRYLFASFREMISDQIAFLHPFFFSLFILQWPIRTAHARTPVPLVLLRTKNISVYYSTLYIPLSEFHEKITPFVICGKSSQTAQHSAASASASSTYWRWTWSV